jgi:hypothetical protein
MPGVEGESDREEAMVMMMFSKEGLGLGGMEAPWGQDLTLRRGQR